MKDHRLAGYKNLLLFTQLGLSVVSPIILCAGMGWLINKYWDTPSWVMAALILIGTASGMASAWKLIRKMLAFSSENDPEDKQ